MSDLTRWGREQDGEVGVGERELEGRFDVDWLVLVDEGVEGCHAIGKWDELDAGIRVKGMSVRLLSETLQRPARAITHCLCGWDAPLNSPELKKARCFSRAPSCLRIV